MQFKYYTGEAVCVGDMVRTGSGHLGVVREIIEPGTELSRMLECIEGGILIYENWDGKESPLVMAAPDGENWEDLQLVRRKEER